MAEQGEKLRFALLASLYSAICSNFKWLVTLRAGVNPSARHAKGTKQVMLMARGQVEEK